MGARACRRLEVDRAVHDDVRLAGRHRRADREEVPCLERGDHPEKQTRAGGAPRQVANFRSASVLLARVWLVRCLSAGLELKSQRQTTKTLVTADRLLAIARNCQFAGGLTTQNGV